MTDRQRDRDRERVRERDRCIERESLYDRARERERETNLFIYLKIMRYQPNDWCCSNRLGGMACDNNIENSVEWFTFRSCRVFAVKV